MLFSWFTIHVICDKKLYNPNDMSYLWQAMFMCIKHLRKQCAGKVVSNVIWCSCYSKDTAGELHHNDRRNIKYMILLLPFYCNKVSHIFFLFNFSPFQTIYWCWFYKGEHLYFGCESTKFSNKFLVELKSFV